MLSRALVRRIYSWLGVVASMVCGVRPRRVALIANYGKGYLCNPKYVADALERLYPGQFDLVLLTNTENDCVPDYVRTVPYRGIRALMTLATAQVWIDNCRGPKYVPKKPSQFYVQMWHAYVQPKQVEADAGEALSRTYVANAIEDGRVTDLMIANNDLQEKIYRESFWYHGPVMRCGVPRNAPLLRLGMISAESVRRKIGVRDGQVLFLYAPTFRANASLGEYSFDFNQCKKVLAERFGGEAIIAYRLHPNLASVPRPAYFDECMDLTDYPDAQELLVAADVLVSDYSSILEDFILTGKPAFIFAPDAEMYDRDRGFYYPLESRPCSVAYTENELFEHIAHFDDIAYRRMRERFLSEIGYEDKGGGDIEVARLLYSLMAADTGTNHAV